MQRHNVIFGKKTRAVFGDSAAISLRACAAISRPPPFNLHTKGFGIFGHSFGNTPITIKPETPAKQTLSNALLPLAILQILHLARYIFHGAHDQRPTMFGGGMRWCMRPFAGTHQNAVIRTSININMRIFAKL